MNASVFSLIPGTKQNRVKRLYQQADLIMALIDQHAKDGGGSKAPVDYRLHDEEGLIERVLRAALAAQQSLGLKPYRPQIACALGLLQGSVVEMQTGEGKTLAAAIGAAVHASYDRRVHVATANDYLAGRDAAALRPFFESLGLTVSEVTPQMPHAVKQSSYQADIVYGTAQEFAFDFLRDNMVESNANRCIPAMDTLIIDEADSILLDQACMPLQISGQPRPVDDLYSRLTQICHQHAHSDAVIVDRKDMFVSVTDDAMDRIELELLKAGLLKGGALYQSDNKKVAHGLQCCLAAMHLYRRDTEYVVENDTVLIVDEHTGRVLPGKRWSDGIHQAVEAKENVTIRPETPIKASMTFQSFVMLYKRMSGLTGTAVTSAEELAELYNTDVICIAPLRDSQRVDDRDSIFMTKQDKYQAIVAEAMRANGKLQPVLIGTDSIEESQAIHAGLAEHGVEAALLTAREHHREAEIIANAGAPGAITIATQMAGRGTDILLGGDLSARLRRCAELHPGDDARAFLAKESWVLDNQAVKEAGGLLVIGANRAPSIRADLQLRGRAGRQGDPGRTLFMCSLEDDLIRTHGLRSQLEALSARLELGPGEALGGRFINNIVRKAQSSRQAQDELLRKELLKYDSVTSIQRETFYVMRNAIVEMLDGEGSADLEAASKKAVSLAVGFVLNRLEEIGTDLDSQKANACQLITRYWSVTVPPAAFYSAQSSEQLAQLLETFANQYWDFRRSSLREDIVKDYMGQSLLKSFDSVWEDTQIRMAELRDGINLRAYANEKPLNVFRKEGYLIMSVISEEAYTMAGMRLLGSKVPNEFLKKG